MKWTVNLPRCEVLAEVGEGPHEPLVDLIQCQLLPSRLQNCLHTRQHSNWSFYFIGEVTHQIGQAWPILDTSTETGTDLCLQSVSQSACKQHGHYSHSQTACRLQLLNAGLMFNFSAGDHHLPLAITKLYRFLIEALCIWTTCPGLLLDSKQPEVKPATLPMQVQRPDHYTIKPHVRQYQQS